MRLIAVACLIACTAALRHPPRHPPLKGLGLGLQQNLRPRKATAMSMKLGPIGFRGGASIIAAVIGLNKDLWTKKVPAVAVVAAVAGGLVGGYSAAQLVHKLRIYRTADDIPSQLVERHATISARVISVTDGDTMRVRHMPAGRRGLWTERKLSEDTIVVRIAAVDTPELAKRGKPGQPFSEEAKKYAESLVLGKKVKVKLLSRDQYNRVVAMVYTPRTYVVGPRRNLSLELLRNGFAVIYRQAGAQYDGQLETFEAAENEMRTNPKNMWADKNFTPPAEFKKSMRAQ